MVEIVFGRSAAGSLKQAGAYGRGKFCSAVSVVFRGGPTEEEKAAAQKAAEEKARLAWEKASPMEVRSEDVYGLEMMLSMGDISEEGFGKGRRDTLRSLCTAFPPDDMEAYIRCYAEETVNALESVFERAKKGEPLRIWYSDDPEEMCGLVWLLTQLEGAECEVSVVKLPDWEESEKGEVIKKRSWGEVAPGEWGAYAPLTRRANTVFRRVCAQKWEGLEKENAPLRAVVNGRLMSVPVDFYDGLIRMVIADQADEFRETDVIIDLLTKHDLGLGDGFIHLRVEEMIKRGELEAVTEAEEGCPAYRRVLRKEKA